MNTGGEKKKKNTVFRAISTRRYSRGTREKTISFVELGEKKYQEGFLTLFRTRVNEAAKTKL